MFTLKRVKAPLLYVHLCYGNAGLIRQVRYSFNSQHGTSAISPVRHTSGQTHAEVSFISVPYSRTQSFQLSLFLGAFRHDHAASPTSRIHHNPAQTMLPCPTTTTTRSPFPQATSRIPVPHHHSTLTMFHPHTTLSLATRPTTSHVLHTLSST